MDADIFISLTHFKGHESTGFGGALKNIGMGCGSRAGKMEMHSSGKPNVDIDICKSCGACVKNCAHDAITFDEHRKAGINHDHVLAVVVVSEHATLMPLIHGAIRQMIFLIIK